MARIVEEAEGAINYWKRFAARDNESDTIPAAISHTACVTARDLGAKAILAATTSGYTARSIARFMPGCPIAAITTSEKVRRSLALTWGVRAYLTGEAWFAGLSFKSDATVCSRCVPRRPARKVWPRAATVWSSRPAFPSDAPVPPT